MNQLCAFTFKEQLKHLNAPKEAIKWASGKTLEQFWSECPTGEWMLWLYERSKNIDQKKLFLAKGYCAKTVIHLMEDKRSKDAVKAAIDFGNKKIDSRQLKKAANAAAEVANEAFGEAAAAAAAEAAAIDRYDDTLYGNVAEATADTAADNAGAEGYDDADHDYESARAASDARIKNMQMTADICRKYLPIPEFN